MKLFEIEQKYRIKNPKTIRAFLKKIGARKIAAGSEQNEFFDRRHSLSKQKIAMRLRRHHRQSALTLKGPRVKGLFSKRMEIEAPVDYQLIKKILRFSGFKIIRKYKKRREIYRFQKALITLDRLPKFGWFLEIEGAKKTILRIERKLGLTPSDREKRSYLHMLFGWKH